MIYHCIRMPSNCIIQACAYITVVASSFIILYTVFPDFKLFEFLATNYILSIFLVISAYCLNKRYCCDGEIQPSNKAVLITGCDSGFGNHFAKRLDTKGFHVFASCLFPEGQEAKDLMQSCSRRLKVLPLDVTKDESVASALNFAKENLGSNVLWAVVNNAGVWKGSAVDFTTIQHFKDTFDVNVLGPLRVTKAFLPLLKKSKGRVVNITSLAGRLPIPYLCAYTMSKHAAVAFTECLNIEMDAWGIRVISIEPELFRTPMTDIGKFLRSIDDELKEIDGNIISSYGEEYLKKFKIFFMTILNHCYSDITTALDAMESAITNKNPAHVYKPSRNWFMLLLRYLAEIIPYGLYAKLCLIVMKIMS